MKNLLNSDISFFLKAKALPSEGNMAWEYNPFRNYRLSKNKYLYQDKFYTTEELKNKFNIYLSNDTWKIEGVDWDKTVNGDYPELFEAGLLVDFETDELNFNINNPVDLLPLYSYDDSVNIIINDGLNQPRLINSRFSAIGKNQYRIVDRKGDNDTNIYDEGNQFDIDTSLYKRTIKIPKLTFNGVYPGGNLGVGNYHFYFKYADADGNETDWIAESGLVSVFLGTTPNSINSGFENQNSKKLVKFRLKNIDSAYSYVKVYYTKETSGYKQTSKTQAFCIEEKFLVEQNGTCNITITGFVPAKTISVDEINIQYLLVSTADTQALCKNMLFLGNVHSPDIPYRELSDLSLRFLPKASYKPYDLELTAQYDINSISKGYYDPTYIYNFTGYWNNELYRLGIVYIMPDNSLSPVFNIRGGYNLTDKSKFSNISVGDYANDELVSRNYINIAEDDYSIISSDFSANVTLENAKGVITLKNYSETTNQFLIYGINISTTNEVIDLLKKYVKGFFFVRLKRIPTTICQALSIGTDKNNNTPTIPISTSGLFASLLTGCNYTLYDAETEAAKKLVETLMSDEQKKAYEISLRNKFETTLDKDKFTENYVYIEESFLDTEDRYLNGDFFTRVRPVKQINVNCDAALCPEAEVDLEYFSNIFTGSDFKAELSDMLPSESYFKWDNEEERNFYINNYNSNSSLKLYSIKALQIPDSSKLMTIGKHNYKAICGNSVDGWKFDYIGYDNKVERATNLLRGIFGTYLGLVGQDNTPLKTYDIKIAGYSTSLMPEYFKIRYNDNSPFYPISDRIDISEVNENIGTFYRGDCYICQFTHRLNRNFQDPSDPINSLIVDQKCWADNYSVTDKVIDKSKFLKINIGDLNAIPLGMWTTFTVRSTKNLCVRGIDESHSDEKALIGHGRGFYPYYSLNLDGSYKTPESDVFNNGFLKEFGAKVSIEVPDVPYIKNEFSNRIIYSNPSINDAFTNNYRVFESAHFKDYTKEFGLIIKLVEDNGSLLCVFEHGIAQIPINEKALLQNAEGDDIYVGASSVLGEPRIISDKFGSLWKDSIIKTPYYIYGVDTVAKKIWRVTAGSANIQTISDMHILQFLNLNITLREREITPVVGIRNVKTHYNAFKLDVMFTFYDNLYGFEEKAWNICWNEITQIWQTMYSWLPSGSENIHNQYFSFDRNTAKWISKLGATKYDSNYADGIVLSNIFINKENALNASKTNPVLIGTFSLINRNIPDGYIIRYSIERDNFGNYKYFEVSDGNNYLITEDTEQKITSELNEPIVIDSIDNFNESYGLILTSPINIEEYPYPVILLNIKAYVYKADETSYMNENLLKEGFYSNTIAICFKEVYDNPNLTDEDAKIPNLTTDFWKHGQAGLQDIVESPKPCMWYGKQHPFEFEFCVNEYPEVLKIFDNLQIISNNAEPESFHYEIIGDQTLFANDKENMYIRQEATKEFYQYNGSDILYDSDWINIENRRLKKYNIPLTIDEYNLKNDNYVAFKTDSLVLNTEFSDDSIKLPTDTSEYQETSAKIEELENQEIVDSNINEYIKNNLNPKSTILPFIYEARNDTFNEIEDYYKSISSINKDYDELSGSEILHDKVTNEYSIWEHQKASDINKSGRLYGNMQYNRDNWYVLIPPINFILKNECTFTENGDIDSSTWINGKVPVTIANCPVPNKTNIENMEIPSDLSGKLIDTSSWGALPMILGKNADGTYNYVYSDIDAAETRQQTKVRDKHIKIRIRYTGDKLAIIRKVITTYSQSL